MEESRILPQTWTLHPVIQFPGTGTYAEPTGPLRRVEEDGLVYGQEFRFRLPGTALSWFTSYGPVRMAKIEIANRTSLQVGLARVFINDDNDDDWPVNIVPIHKPVHEVFVTSRSPVESLTIVVSLYMAAARDGK